MPLYAKVESWQWWVPPTPWAWVYIVIISLLFLALLVAGATALTAWLIIWRREFRAKRKHPVLSARLRQKRYDALHPDK